MLYQGTPPPVYSSIETGQLAVTTTAAQIADESGCALVRLSAPAANSATVYVGPVGVTTSTGTPLAAGTSRLFFVDLALLYAVAASAQSVSYEVYR